MLDKKLIMDKFECGKCGHTWKQRGKNIPKKCPSCTNPNWNKRSIKDILKIIIK